VGDLDKDISLIIKRILVNWMRRFGRKESGSGR